MNDNLIPFSKTSLSLIEYLRVGRKAVLFLLWLLITLLPWTCLHILCVVKPRWRLPLKYAMQRLIAKGTLRLFNIHLTVKGPLPKRPYFLVSNHLSYVDIVILSSMIGGTYVAKKEAQAWPLFGLITDKFWGSIFIDRNSKQDLKRVIQLFSEKIAAQEGIVVYPEGTTSHGQHLLPFLASLLVWPAKQDFPVHYASLSYQTQLKEKPASHYVCWWGDEDFLPHLVQLLSLPRVNAYLAFSEKPIHCHDRKQLTNQLEHGVKQLFAPCD